MRNSRLVRTRGGSRLSRRRSRPSSFELPLTSLMDAMVIILVFLLKSSSSNTVQISPLPGLELPISKFSQVPQDAPQISITESAISFENKIYRWPEGAPVPRSLPFFQLERTLRRENLTPQTAVPLAVIADKQLPYPMLARVLKAAARGGFTEFRFFALKPE